VKTYSYRERLIIKSRIRLNRLHNDRIKMIKGSPVWLAKTRLITIERDNLDALSSGLGDAAAQHPVRGSVYAR